MFDQEKGKKGKDMTILVDGNRDVNGDSPSPTLEIMFIRSLKLARW